jgi:hypothetical protein
VFGDMGGNRVLDEGDIQSRYSIEVAVRRTLRLIDLTGPGLQRAGADARITIGDDYSISRRWAVVFWRHPIKADGLLYRSRHDPEQTAVALFDRAQDAMTVRDMGSLAGPAMVLETAVVLERYSFGLSA